MHVFAHFALLAGLFVCVAAGGASAWAAWKGGRGFLPWVEKAQLAVLVLTTASSAVLSHALFWKDYSNLYVAGHVDNTLPGFYRITAFWAGQEGSLLFWAWMIAIMGALAVFCRSYKDLKPETRHLYWAILLLTQGFFLMLLTGQSNPFMMIANPPADGQGLNPLLQHPGMIFHPPLLFLGYAGFTVPVCLALASVLNRDTGSYRNWVDMAHNWVILAWIFLTAGIVLGAWWSYMELGWGGYWAWDPVENSSLLPWLTATAYIHTAIVTRRRGALPRTSMAILALTLIMCFFATYVVRSGVIESLHAFGDAGVGTPLLLFLIFWIIMSGVAVVADATPSRRLDGLVSRQGFLVMLSWLLLALTLVVFIGTMWPVLGKLGGQEKTVGLEAGFYNRACSPLFAMISVLLFFCPWLGWKGGVERRKPFFIALAMLALAVAGSIAWGMNLPVPILAAGTAIAFIPTAILLFAVSPDMRGRVRAWGAYGVHIGLAMMILGVAFSGPYQREKELILKPGENATLGRYSFTYNELRETRTSNMIAMGAQVDVRKDGQPYGELVPERRLYNRFDQPFAEADVIPSLGDELYASLIGFTEDKVVSLKVSVHPMVNWIWIGSTLMCLVGFATLSLRRKSAATADDAVTDSAAADKAEE